MNNRAPLVSEDELRLVKDYVLLLILLNVLDKDIETLKTIKLKMTNIYITNWLSVHQKVCSDIVELKREFRNRGIKIYEQKRTKESIVAKYLCRGYHHDLSMLWGLVKAEVEKKLSVYLGVDLTGGVTK